MWLPGFDYQRVDVEGISLNCAVAGSGPPLLMLHGYPENHLTWRHVAPVLAEDHTVVLADLRGYGDSGKPAPDPAGLVYSKRAMARDQVGLIASSASASSSWPATTAAPGSRTGWSWTTRTSSPSSPSWTSFPPGTSCTT